MVHVFISQVRTNWTRLICHLMLHRIYVFSDGLLLGDNPWICSCNLVWLSQWLRRWAKETRKAYAFNVDMDPSHWSSLFDVSCTTSDQNALRARLIEFQRDIQVTCSPVSSSSSSSYFSSSSPFFFFPIQGKNYLFKAISWSVLSLIQATLVTLLSSSFFPL